MATWADEQAVAEAIENWSRQQVECRAYGHNWRSLQVLHWPGVYNIRHRCVRCRNERWRNIDERGNTLTSWRAHYEPGYLVKGLGRIPMSGKAMLRLSNLEIQDIQEVEEP